MPALVQDVLLQWSAVPGLDTGLVPDVSLEFLLERTPASAGTDAYRWASRPLAGVEFIEGRVTSRGWGAIRREASDEQGNHAIGQASVEINDDDGLVRGWLHDSETAYLEHREASCRLHSPAGRFAGTHRDLFRGLVSDVQLSQRVSQDGHHRTAIFELKGALAPYLDRTIPKHVFTAADFPGIDPRLIGRPIPLVGGEHSDAGAEDTLGNSVTKGFVPPIFVGQRRTVNDNPTNGVPAMLAAPVLSAVLVGTGGTTLYTYGITAHSAVGETTISNTVSVLGPAVLDGSNYIQLTWTDVPGATGFTLYGRINPTPVRRLLIAQSGTLTDRKSVV